VIKPILEENTVSSAKITQNSMLITSNAGLMTNRVSIKWFMDKVWPELHKDISLTLTGKDYKNYFKTLDKNHTRVTYTGFLKNSELNKVFDSAKVVVNPSRIGSGFKIKSLDALSRGKILISTEFANHFGKTIQSSDSPQKLAELINEAVQSKTTESKFNYSSYYAQATKELLKFLS
jgi:glycosyltransferase involved in cell wall biosynthesis